MGISFAGEAGEARKPFDPGTGWFPVGIAVA